MSAPFVPCSLTTWKLVRAAIGWARRKGRTSRVVQRRAGAQASTLQTPSSLSARDDDRQGPVADGGRRARYPNVSEEPRSVIGLGRRPPAVTRPARTGPRTCPER